MKYEKLFNYTMLSLPKEAWSAYITQYAVDHKLINWKEGVEFVLRYSDGFTRISHCLTAMEMCGVIDAEWAKPIIKKHLTEKHVQRAVELLRGGGFSIPSWQLEIVKELEQGA